MDEQAEPVSPELLAANRRLYELRAQVQAARLADYQPAAELARPVGVAAAWENAPAQPDDARKLVEKISSLPEHLGWGSAALTAVFRRQKLPLAADVGNSTPALATQSVTSRGNSGSVAGASEVFPAEPAAGVRGDGGAMTETATAIAGDGGQLDGVKLYPDIGLGMLRREQAAAGRLWLLLRHLDQKGQGSLRIVDIYQQLTSTPQYLCGRRQLRNLLKDGEGIFWTRDRENIWLRSAAKVAHALGVERLAGQPVTLPVAMLLSGIGTFRAHLYAAFHSSRMKESVHGPQVMPISRGTLARLSAVRASSQRTYEARVGIATRANYVVGAVATKEAKEDHAWQHGQAVFDLKDHRGRQGRAGEVYLARQLPNSYLGVHAQRTKGRQKRINRELKDLVEIGMPGNVERTDKTPKPAKCYFPNGKLASRAQGLGPDQKRYWIRPVTGVGHHALWHCMG